MSKRIALVDVDGSKKFPNLALMKISALHKKRGDTVEWLDLFKDYDIAYKSKVFTNSPDINYEIKAAEIRYGGTGYGLGAEYLSDMRYKKLIYLPGHIEESCPDYSLYPQFKEAYGFLTRGCPRSCEFCIVTRKEGRMSRQVADIRDFWRNQKSIKLLDPNLLACIDREKLLKQLAATNSYIDFTQGLDIRLVDLDIIGLLNSLKVKMLHFAWDNPKEDLTDMFKWFAKHTNVSCVIRAMATTGQMA